jgi:hypothetical protein
METFEAKADPDFGPVMRLPALAERLGLQSK